MKSQATSTCQACGARVPAGLDFCPVCALRGALDDARETSEFDVNPTHSSPASRFDHYELLTKADGTPLELGHGAMGVTYKALDINLRCAVALKVINARFIGDESAPPPLCKGGTRCSQRSPSECGLGVSSVDSELA